jgi:hypothetical protein
MTVTDPIHPAQPMVPRAPKPPLDARQKSGARIAGIVAFLMLNLGFALLWIPLALLAVVGVVTFILTALDRAVYRPGSMYEGMIGFVDSLNPSAAVVPLLLVALFGAAIMVAALFVSVRILRSHGSAKPWPVTWAGAGIAIASKWLVAGVLVVPFQVITSSADDNRMQALPIAIVPIAIVLGVISLLATVAIDAVIGAVAWWLSAHLLRPPAVAPDNSTVLENITVPDNSKVPDDSRGPDHG